MIKRLLLAIVAVIALASSARAGDLRCGGRLISEGQSKYEVLALCGQPTFVDERREVRIRRDFFFELFPEREKRERERLRVPFLVEEEVIIEIWVYNLGSNRFIRMLTFENGVLVEIKTGGYGW